MNESHDSEALRRRYDKATADLAPPFAVVDAEAFDANGEQLRRRAGGMPVRLATKSLRSAGMIRRALAVEGFSGALGYALSEALWLVRRDVVDDVVVGYPSADRRALAELIADEKAARCVTLMVDDVAQLDLVDSIAPPTGRPSLRVCLDLDASWRPLGGRFHVGVRRSPVHAPIDAVRLAKRIVARPGFDLVGMMSYEAQISGVGQQAGLRSPAVRFVQHRSFAELRRRRGAAVAAVRQLADLEFVNGGGTGSLSVTALDESVTELTAGSGFYAPALFDGYDAFKLRPAAAFALSVTRRPAPDVATLHGGGWPASGEAGASRLPRPWLPEGLELLAAEGAGEVQTPVTGAPARDLRVGDRVWFRHAKAGELAERVAELHLISGDEVTDVVATYRGEGQAFL
ncbi:MAG: alanine racemase [Stackebrandtia sp.]